MYFSTLSPAVTLAASSASLTERTRARKHARADCTRTRQGRLFDTKAVAARAADKFELMYEAGPESRGSRDEDPSAESDEFYHDAIDSKSQELAGSDGELLRAQGEDSETVSFEARESDKFTLSE